MVFYCTDVITTLLTFIRSKRVSSFHKADLFFPYVFFRFLKQFITQKYPSLTRFIFTLPFIFGNSKGSSLLFCGITTLVSVCFLDRGFGLISPFLIFSFLYTNYLTLEKLFTGGNKISNVWGLSGRVVPLFTLYLRSLMGVCSDFVYIDPKCFS